MNKILNCSLSVFLSQLKELFPRFRLALPPKRWFKDNYDMEFLEERQLGLQAFLQNLIAHRDITNRWTTAFPLDLSFIQGCLTTCRFQEKSRVCLLCVCLVLLLSVSAVSAHIVIIFGGCPCHLSDL